MAGVWRPETLNLAIVAKLRELLGLPAGQVLAAAPDAVLVPHVSDVWGLPVVATLPGNARVAEIAPRFAQPTDATDIVVVDWLCDQTARWGSTVALLGGPRHRVAPIEDGGAFTGTGDTEFRDWLRYPGTPHGLAGLLDSARVAELTTRAVAAEPEFLAWLDSFGAATDPDHADWCADILAERLDLMIEGVVS